LKYIISEGSIKNKCKNLKTQLSNLKYEYNILKNLKEKRHSFPKNNDLNSNNNNKVLREKIRNLNEDCYYEKELYLSTKQKLENQNKKINLLYKEHDNLKDKEKKIEEENQLYQNQLESELTSIEYNIKIEKKNYLYQIEEQNKEIESLEYEIERLKKKKEQLKNKLFKKSTSLKNIFENSEKYPLNGNEIFYIKKQNIRPNSIESKTKRKPFNNFNFV
jgi:chromosome segregation ATPase